MIKQYPHKLYLEALPATNSTQDGDGNYDAQSSTPTLLGDCREETDGRGREIQGIDGKSYRYSSVIYLPKSAQDLRFGDVVFVRDAVTSTTNRIKGNVLKFDRGQLHCRIWL